MRMLAHIARKYDRGYGHFTTRQNIQYNWPRLSDTPDTPELASVEMHALQTSGNCIRNVTAGNPFRGAAADEVADPRPLCRNPQAMVERPSGVLVPAAQVQDRGDRRERDAQPFRCMTSAAPEEGRKGKLGFAVYVGGGRAARR